MTTIDTIALKESSKKKNNVMLNLSIGCVFGLLLAVLIYQVHLSYENVIGKGYLRIDLNHILENLPRLDEFIKTDSLDNVANFDLLFPSSGIKYGLISKDGIVVAIHKPRYSGIGGISIFVPFKDNDEIKWRCFWEGARINKCLPFDQLHEFIQANDQDIVFFYKGEI